MALFQQDREKLNYNWIIAKKELDDQKSELINKDREIEDAKENHIMSINLFNQKFGFFLSLNQFHTLKLKKDKTSFVSKPRPAVRIKKRS